LIYNLNNTSPLFFTGRKLQPPEVAGRGCSLQQMSLIVKKVQSHP